jgi:AraC-like DNA-binding protein
MISGCIDRISRDACDGCERRDACASLFANLFGSRAQRRPSAYREPRPRQERRNPFLALLGQVAKAIEQGSRTGEGEKRAQATGFRHEVERHLEPLLPSGAIRMEKVARAMRCSRQTLYRRLKAEGVTFEQLLDDLRRRLALRLVREPGLSVKQIAYRLGFSEPAAFSRAFKRWTGRTPHHARHAG